MTKRRSVAKLSVTFTMVVVGSAILSIVLFAFLFFNRFRIFNSLISEQALEKSMSTEVKKLQKSITKKHISKNDNKQIRQEMHKFRNLTMYLFDTDEDIEIEHSLSKLDDKVYIGTSSFLLILYEPNVEYYDLHFYDGSYNLRVYSYQGVSFMERYLLIISSISAAIFLILILWFVHKKMKYVLSIQKEMELIEHGDYHHVMVYKGNDELTALARQLNHLRNTLYDNNLREDEARSANEELVTTMSHDLRTPLTSLLGYLDILHMKIYKNEQECEHYLSKSKQKAEQIRVMSDKLLHHFLINSFDENLKLQILSVEEFNLIMNVYVEDLKDQRFEIDVQLVTAPFQLVVDESILQRIFDNIFSNLKKYAEKKYVVLTVKIKENQLTVNIKNRKKKNVSWEESNHIGLKSVNRMMKDLKGNLTFEEDQKHFVIELSFPCQMIEVSS